MAEPSFGRIGERFLKGLKVVLKDVSRRERARSVLQAEEQHLESHNSMKLIGVSHGNIRMHVLFEVSHARKAIVKNKVAETCGGLY